MRKWSRPFSFLPTWSAGSCHIIHDMLGSRSKPCARWASLAPPGITPFLVTASLTPTHFQADSVHNKDPAFVKSLQLVGSAAFTRQLPRTWAACDRWKPKLTMMQSLLWRRFWPPGWRSIRPPGAVGARPASAQGARDQMRAPCACGVSNNYATACRCVHDMETCERLSNMRCELL